ncbi:MAG TPA: RHS repeat-associated core domain-containing protein, partial [Anaerohalosphaeraceae bacterium]|nr:RHS repeat-associated core domain-containing protein [Anaerohalosphaeraceae bacterium]
RQYDPQLLRFTSRDPVFGGRENPLSLHRYLYCANDPINRLDRNGKFAITIGGSASGNFNMNDIVKATTYGKQSLFGDVGGFMSQGLLSGFMLDVAAYTMIAMPLFTMGAGGFGAEGGLSLVVAHDDHNTGGFWDGWDVGIMIYGAAGGSFNTGGGTSLTFNMGYSPYAQKVEDLNGFYVELGGSISVPVFGVTTLGGSWARNLKKDGTVYKNDYDEVVDLWSVSIGKGSSIGAEGHYYLGYSYAKSFVK